MFTGFYVAAQKSDTPHYVIFPVSIYWPTSCSAPFIKRLFSMLIEGKGAKIQQ